MIDIKAKTYAQLAALTPADFAAMTYTELQHAETIGQRHIETLEEAGLTPQTFAYEVLSAALKVEREKKRDALTRVRSIEARMNLGVAPPPDDAAFIAEIHATALRIRSLMSAIVREYEAAKAGA